MTDQSDTPTQGDKPRTPLRDTDPHVEPAVVEDLDLPDQDPDNLRGGRCHAPDIFLPGVTYVPG